MNNTDILQFHTKSISPRLKYINHIVFELILGLRVEYCLDSIQFDNIIGPKVNYTHLKIHNSINIEPDSLLFENDIQAQDPHFEQLDDTYILFPNQEQELPFDLLAACFYIVSRYEEYTSMQKDTHQRFPAEASLQYKLGILKVPIVQIWADMLKKSLQSKFAQLQFKKQPFAYLPTFDIDMAWSFKEKGIYRASGAILKSLSRLDLASLKKRWQVNMGKKKDPFDTFDYILQQTTKHNYTPLFFFLVGRRSLYDKNISPDNKNFIQLIQSIAAHYPTGLHPSYYYESYLSEELGTLQNIIEKTIGKSRQHYVRLSLPSTYQELLKHQIHADYSMGYPDRLGFRNGLAIATPWYDLTKEKHTDLMIHPFQIMDVTLKNYLQKTPAQAINLVHDILDTVCTYGGTCISIWHNSSFDHQWAGWSKVFEEMLSYAKKLKA